jgi:hypothetical protein
MSYKSQLFQSSLRERLLIGPSWGTSSASLPPNLLDIKLVSPWLDYDAKVRPGLVRRIKWNTVLGLALASAFSAGIWTSIVVVIARMGR